MPYECCSLFHFEFLSFHIAAPHWLDVVSPPPRYMKYEDTTDLMRKRWDASDQDANLEALFKKAWDENWLPKKSDDYVFVSCLQ